MSKIAFSKLNLKESKEINTISISNNHVEVKCYLPINDKLGLISDVINQARDNNNFPNPVKLAMFFGLEVVFNYTNISFTDKQKEDLVKLYDNLNSNGIITLIMEAIPSEEINNLEESLYDCAYAIYDYDNSVRGILDALQTDYKNLEFDIDSLRAKIADPENLALLKAIQKDLG